MLNNLLESFKKEELLQTILVGEVVDNKDPKQIGRCRIKINGINDTLPIDKLPWTVQMFPNGTGQETDPDNIQNYSSANIPLRDSIPNWKIPAIGTMVVVIFPDNDIYSSFYIGELMYEPLDKGPLLEDYPETWGNIDKTNNRFWVNMIKGTVNFHHFTETWFRIDKNGTINWYGVEDLNITIEDNCKIHIIGMQNENIDKEYNLTVGDNFNTKVIKNTSLKIGENYKIDVAKNTDFKTGSNYNVNVGQSTTFNTGQTYNHTAGSSINLKAPIINLN